MDFLGTEKILVRLVEDRRERITESLLLELFCGALLGCGGWW